VTAEPLTGEKIRKTLLEVIRARAAADQRPLSDGMLEEAARQLGIHGHHRYKVQAHLTVWHDLFRTGYLAWGLDLANPGPPWCPLTAQDHRALAHRSSLQPIP